MKKIVAFTTLFFGAIAPIELCIIILFFVMIIDTVVKLISLKIISKKEKRPFKDLYASRMLRKGYIYKSAGYFILAGALFPLDYFMLTPFLNGSLSLFWNGISIPNSAIFTNALLVIFSIIELSSINENWFDITGNNIFKSVFKTVKAIRKAVESTSSFIRKTKDDL
jgi:hypothetical protein